MRAARDQKVDSVKRITLGFWTIALCSAASAQPCVTPIQLGTYNTLGYARGVAVVGNHAYIADTGNGLLVIDVTNPNAPVLMGSYDTPGDAIGIAVVGTLAYVADGTAGLQIIDISDPFVPTRLGSYNTTGIAFGVTVVGNRAYVADGFSGLQIIDVTHPAAPIHLGGLRHTRTGAGRCDLGRDRIRRRRLSRASDHRRLQPERDFAPRLV